MAMRRIYQAVLISQMLYGFLLPSGAGDWEVVLTLDDGPYSIKPYKDHRSYPLSLDRQEDGNTVVKFLFSGEKTDNVFELSPVFFENWYRYQDDVVVNGAKTDLMQLFFICPPSIPIP
ncbi:hypothetical protein N7519_011439 [Penicillium mononematosum]|uniref:uncharacterized protein n=1 Tax=Penicillium mononematosum TaxID=268346 RepID=UPI002546F2E4|nr:uncharacterized protein N7519_011439 [Penicillium mononematosum]KAJ6180978.1 hypothetical protein N7519_011439 [Penicillium mononematosum]